MESEISELLLPAAYAVKGHYSDTSERNGGPLHVSQLLEPIVLENALRSSSKLHPARPVLGLKAPITP